MNQVVKDQILKQWDEYDKKDFSEEYEYFNSNYSLAVLNTLSVEEQAKKLFASVEYSNANGNSRGYFCWAEHGRKKDKKVSIPFGTAKGWTGAQDGPVIEKDGSAHFYDIGTTRRQRTRIIIDDAQLKVFTLTTMNALNKICELTKNSSLDTIEDYRSLNLKIKSALVGLNENRLYWKSSGEPSGQLIKYLHCSFPKKFFCWYSQGKLQNLLEEIDPSINRDEDAFVLNGILTKLAGDIGINDLDNFGVMVGRLIKKDHRSAFETWMSKQIKPSGDRYATGTIKTYTRSMQQGFKKFSPLNENYKTIFYIGDPVTLEQASKDIVEHPDFKEFTERSGNGACQAGLSKYKEYLTGEENEIEVETEDTTSITVDNETGILDIEKNTILYGPPGTGKTYSTMQYAVAIIENRSLSDVQSDDEEYVKTAYKNYNSDGLIEFITFHQSYGYEDFIEGIKPNVEAEETENDEGNVKYNIVPGVFKTFCDKSKRASGITLSSLGLNNTPTIWKVSLKGTGDNTVRKDCLDNDRIRIGYDSYGKDLPEELGDGKKVLNAFYYGMKIGDVVLSCYSASTIDAIGVITGDPEWIDSYPDGYYRTRAVHWILKGINEDITSINNNKTLSMPTVYRLNNIALDDVFSIIIKYNPNSKESDDKNESNRVFIIDEINRGNISKIFGELITLIEANKRIGASEEKYAILPYTQKKFGVPNNVYILGTMNTADRSIATIDTALRRRFDFVEMLPNAEYLDDIVVEDELYIKDLFVKMNQKITALYDRDHTIGQAYFKPLVDEQNESGKATIHTLGRIFRKRIIPLLQEYFYDDYDKIRMILGDNKTQIEAEQFIKASNKDYSSLFGSNILDSEIVISYEINEDAFENMEAYKHI